jgi:hypothetical protein
MGFERRGEDYTVFMYCFFLYHLICLVSRISEISFLNSVKRMTTSMILSYVFLLSPAREPMISIYRLSILRYRRREIPSSLASSAPQARVAVRLPCSRSCTSRLFYAIKLIISL